MSKRNSSPRLTISLALLLTGSLGFLGCDKNKPGTENPSTGDDVTTEDPAPGDGDTTEPVDEGPVAWADMDRDARLTFMGTKVMPAMKEAFKQQGFDSFKCDNCHGEDKKEVDFEMPNDLTPLNAEDPIQSGMDLDEEMAKFMVSEVVPQMSDLLGEEVNCMTCHLSDD